MAVHRFAIFPTIPIITPIIVSVIALIACLALTAPGWAQNDGLNPDTAKDRQDTVFGTGNLGQAEGIEMGADPNTGDQYMQAAPSAEARAKKQQDSYQEYFPEGIDVYPLVVPGKEPLVVPVPQK